MPDPPKNFKKEPSLDEIVSQRAVVIAEQIQNAAAWAKSEMDLQVEVAGALKEFARKAQVTLVSRVGSWRTNLSHFSAAPTTAKALLATVGVFGVA